MNNEERRIVELENDPVSKLLGDLKRVDAPGDFDFRVKARIAAGRPVKKNGAWLPAVAKLAVPLALLLLIGAFFGYNALYSPNNIAVAPVRVAQDAVPVAEVQTIEPAVPVPNQDIAKRVKDITSVPGKNAMIQPTEKKIVPARPFVKRQPEGRFRDSALRIAQPIFPKGIEPNGKIDPQDLDRVVLGTVSAKEILSFLGLETDASWKVGAVRPNSAAERSGVKAGDVVEAINDQKLVERSTFVNKFKGGSLRVNRDGKRIQIELKP